jgi:hypothetical protein
VANVSFSVFAAVASLLITVGAAVRGATAVAIVFGLLTVGFVARATETFWRPRR